jgi:hypothetical protein
MSMEQPSWDEFSAAMKKRSQERRASNRDSSARILELKTIPFKSKNNGAHLIVNNGEVDFWPGTGLWIFRKCKSRGRGVYTLIYKLQNNRG